MEESRYFIYGLVDPRSGELRYVGQTSVGMRRPLYHSKASTLKKNTNPHKCNWIRKLQTLGTSYEVEILEAFESRDRLDEAEEHWIGYFRMIGSRLLNANSGGAGNKGFKQSEEHKRKIGRALVGQKRSESSLINYRAGQTKDKGVAVVDQHGRQFPSVSEAGRVLGINHCNISAVLTGNRKSAGGLLFRYV